jgi:hypothetical protein
MYNKVTGPIVLVVFQQKKSSASTCFWPTKARAVLFFEFFMFEQNITSFQQVPLVAHAFNSTLSRQMKCILTFCYEKTLKNTVAGLASPMM